MLPDVWDGSATSESPPTNVPGCFTWRTPRWASHACKLKRKSLPRAAERTDMIGRLFGRPRPDLLPLQRPRLKSWAEKSKIRYGIQIECRQCTLGFVSRGIHSPVKRRITFLTMPSNPYLYTYGMPYMASGRKLNLTRCSASMVSGRLQVELPVDHQTVPFP